MCTVSFVFVDFLFHASSLYFAILMFLQFPRAVEQTTLRQVWKYSGF